MSITPNAMRAKIGSACLFCSSFFGLSLGTAIVGYLTTHVFGEDALVGRSLFVVKRHQGSTGMCGDTDRLKPYGASLAIAQRAPA